MQPLLKIDRFLKGVWSFSPGWLMFTVFLKQKQLKQPNSRIYRKVRMIYVSQGLLSSSSRKNS